MNTVLYNMNKHRELYLQNELISLKTLVLALATLAHFANHKLQANESGRLHLHDQKLVLEKLNEYIDAAQLENVPFLLQYQNVA